MKYLENFRNNDKSDLMQKYVNYLGRKGVEVSIKSEGIKINVTVDGLLTFSSSGAFAQNAIVAYLEGIKVGLSK